MAKREQLSLVKFRVREKALTLGNFTIPEIIKATRLKEASVRNEVRHMKNEGLLVAETMTSTEESSERSGGRPQTLYSLSPDPEKRIALAREVDRFYSGRTDGRRSEERARPADKAVAAYAAKASASLSGVQPVATETPRLVVSNEFERASIEYSLGNYDRAEALFNQARESALLFGLPDKAVKAEEYLHAVAVQRRLKREGQSTVGRVQSLFRMMRGSVEKLWLLHPLTIILRDLLAQLLTEHEQLLNRLATLKQQHSMSLSPAGYASNFGETVPQLGLVLEPTGRLTAAADASLVMPAGNMRLKPNIFTPNARLMTKIAAHNAVLSITSYKGKAALAELMSDDSTVEHYRPLQDEARTHVRSGAIAQPSPQESHDEQFREKRSMKRTNEILSENASLVESSG